jgi:hypothetical protein
VRPRRTDEAGYEPVRIAGWAPYRGAARLLAWAVDNFAEFEHLVLSLPGLRGDDAGGSSAGWLTRLSPRLACNLVYIHLRNQAEHVEKCTQRACVSGCGYLRLHASLDAPLLPSDRREDARIAANRAALLRGEIPVTA